MYFSMQSACTDTMIYPILHAFGMPVHYLRILLVYFYMHSACLRRDTFFDTCRGHPCLVLTYPLRSSTGFIPERLILRTAIRHTKQVRKRYFQRKCSGLTGRNDAKVRFGIRVVFVLHPLCMPPARGRHTF